MNSQKNVDLFPYHKIFICLIVCLFGNFYIISSLFLSLFFNSKLIALLKCCCLLFFSFSVQCNANEKEKRYIKKKIFKLALKNTAFLELSLYIL
jgi:hypothetical protein